MVNNSVWRLLWKLMFNAGGGNVWKFSEIQNSKKSQKLKSVELSNETSSSSFRYLCWSEMLKNYTIMKDTHDIMLPGNKY